MKISTMNLRKLLLNLYVITLCFMLVACTKQTAPDVSFTDIKGNQFNLAQLKGNVVMVNFWATSCTTCVAEIPNMIQLYEKYHDQGLKYVAVAMSYDPPNYVLNFTETRKLPFTVVLDVNEKIAQAFGDIKLTPTTFVIDKKNNIVKKYVGVIEPEQVDQLIATQLKEGSLE